MHVCMPHLSDLRACMNIIIAQEDLSIKDTLGPCYFVHCREVVHSSEVHEQCISTIGKSTFGVLERVLCREVIPMVSTSFIRSVL